MTALPLPLNLMNDLTGLALSAGSKVMEIYAGNANGWLKDDKSPVTEADLAAEKIILEGLARLAPDIPVISEEATAQGKEPVWGKRFFLVDPLDGTREFLSRNGEFTVNIALIEDRLPVAGVVYAPAVNRLFRGEAAVGAAQAVVKPGLSADECNWRAISVRQPPAGGLTAVASRSHCDDDTRAWLARHNITNVVSAGSSLKLCLVAAGEADAYPRFGRTMEWDTAAGHAVLAAAGGMVKTVTGEDLVYAKAHRGFDNPGFIASGMLLPEK